MRTFVLVCVVAVAHGTPHFSSESLESFPDSNEDYPWEDNSGSLESSLALAGSTAWENAAFDFMNELRAQAYMPPLKYNTSIAAGAQKWANNIACSPSHTPKDLWKGEFTGENLAGLYMSKSEEDRAKDGVQRWYDEVQNYTCAPLVGNYFQSSYYKNIGHYMNMMRKDIQSVGLGMAGCESDPTEGQLVARFYGDFMANLPMYREQLKAQGLPHDRGCCKGLDYSAFVPCPNSD